MLVRANVWARVVNVEEIVALAKRASKHAVAFFLLLVPKDLEIRTSMVQRPCYREP